jgi:chorismate dehydratase
MQPFARVARRVVVPRGRRQAEVPSLAQEFSHMKGRLLRVGGVRYLNARPLIHRLTELTHEADLILDVPSRLADQLADGRLDVALIPSIEYFRAGRYRIVPGIAIAAHGPVRSVKLWCRVPPSDIRTLALDEGSRTSAALARIWLHRFHGVCPAVVPLPLGCPPDRVPTDAVLIIGDRGMHPAPRECFSEEYDMSLEWLRCTGLPFVFAFWAVAPGVDLRGVEGALQRAKERGLAEAVRIARQAAQELQLSEQECLEYITRHIRYDLGKVELEGLQLFYRWAQELSLAPPGVELRFYDQANLAKVR